MPKTNILGQTEKALVHLLFRKDPQTDIETILEVLTILAPSDSEEGEYYDNTDLKRVEKMLEFVKKYPGATDADLIKEARRIYEATK